MERARRWCSTGRCAVEFDQDAIECLSPEVRIEVQSYYLLRDTKRRDYRGSERRGRPVATATQLKTGRNCLQGDSWPRFPEWPVHSVPASMRVPWPASYLATVKVPGWQGFRRR
jgi:hypothetical protein